MDWQHFIDLPSGRTPGQWEQPHLEAALPVLGIRPGETAIDVGCLDGRWTFAMEAAGATVTAIDIVDRDTFRHAHTELRSKATYVIDDATTIDIGTADVVWCSGVVYHVANPLALLAKLRASTKRIALIETACVPRGVDNWTGRTYPNGDGSVHFIPSPEVFDRWLSWAGFRIVYRDEFPRDRRYVTIATVA